MWLRLWTDSSLTDWPSVAMWLWLWVSGDTRVEAGSNTSTMTLRVVGGDEKGSLKSDTVKYGREYQGTPTRGRLRWQGPAAYTKERPILSSERAPHKKQNRNCQNNNKYLVMSPRWGSTPRLTYWLTERQSQSDFDFNFRLSAVQLSEVKWSSWLVSERVQLRTGSWVELYKGGWDEMAQWLSWQSTRVQLRDIRTTVTTWAQEVEESPLLEAFASERLLKTQQAGKSLTGAVMVCELWRLAIAL
jgi:hypothetical protein